MNDRRLDRLKRLAAGTVLISGAALAQPTPKQAAKPEIRTNSPGPMAPEEPAPVLLNSPKPPDPVPDAGVPSPKPPVRVNSPPKTKP